MATGSPLGDMLSRVHWSVSGDIFGCHNVGGATGILSCVWSSGVLRNNAWESPTTHFLIPNFRDFAVKGRVLAVVGKALGTVAEKAGSGLLCQWLGTMKIRGESWVLTEEGFCTRVHLEPWPRTNLCLVERTPLKAQETEMTAGSKSHQKVERLHIPTAAG